MFQNSRCLFDALGASLFRVLYEMIDIEDLVSTSIRQSVPSMSRVTCSFLQDVKMALLNTTARLRAPWEMGNGVAIFLLALLLVLCFQLMVSQRW